MVLGIEKLFWVMVTVRFRNRLRLGMDQANQLILLFSNSLNAFCDYPRRIVERFFALGFELSLALGLTLQLGLILGLWLTESYSITICCIIFKLCKPIYW